MELLERDSLFTKLSGFQYARNSIDMNNIKRAVINNASMM